MLTVTQEGEINLFSVSCEWEHLPEVGGMISDSSDNSWWLS